MYPHTPPTLAFWAMWLYIFHNASPSGTKPTSSKTANSGLSYWQNPLKNQLWDDSLPRFLYFVTKNRFIFGPVFYWFAVYCSYSRSSWKLFYPFLGTSLFLVIVAIDIGTRKQFKRAKLSRVEMYSLQNFLVSFNACFIIGEHFLIF